MRPYLLLVLFPYAAVGLLCCGLAIRYSLTRRELADSGLPELRELLGGRSWRVGLLLLLLAHLAGLLLPRQLMLWNHIPVRLYLLEGLLAAAGLLTFCGWAAMLWRQMKTRNGSTGAEIGDTVFLSLGLMTLLSGLLIAVLYRWGSSWGVATLTPYMRSLARGKPSAAFASEMPFLVQLHLFSTWAALAALPLTRVAPFLILALHRGLGFLLGPVAVSLRLGRAVAGAVLHKYNPAPRLWPEEED